VDEMKYVYGPVPSRRLGLSLGVSPIPKKTCNYSCVYCQLGRTDHMTNTRQMFFPVDEIIAEFDKIIKECFAFDVVTIVGEGEPTLYLGLGRLIGKIRQRTDRPVAVITNGSLLFDAKVQSELSKADIILPTMDAYDEAFLKKINRPHGSLDFEKIRRGLEDFSEKYRGQIWIEIMLIKDVNDDEAALRKYYAMLKNIKYDKLYINTPVRPPAEPRVKAAGHEKMERAADILGGIAIDLPESRGFFSEIKDDYTAILSIIKRHPMNQFEIEGFLMARGCFGIDAVFNRLKEDERVIAISYKGYDTYRLK